MGANGSDRGIGIAELLERPGVRELLRQYASAHRPGMSADDFLSWVRPRVRMSGNAGRAVALKAGLSSKTSRKLALRWAPGIATVGVIAGLLGRGVEIDSATETDGSSIVVVGQIPSSPAHFGGTVTCEVVRTESGSLVTIDVEFPGQAFAWGAGRRLIKAVATVAPRAAEAVDQLDEAAG